MAKKLQPISFDLVALLANSAAPLSLTALAIAARDITGNLAIGESDVRAQLQPLLARGAIVRSVDGKYSLK